METGKPLLKPCFVSSRSRNSFGLSYGGAASVARHGMREGERKRERERERGRKRERERERETGRKNGTLILAQETFFLQMPNRRRYRVTILLGAHLKLTEVRVYAAV